MAQADSLCYRPKSPACHLGPERAAVFLDRDGTVVHDAGYPRDPAQVRLLDGAAAALGRLRDHGFALVLVSNQSGIGRGLVTLREAEAVHAQVAALLEQAGVRFDGAYYCPHAPDAGCACRKPAPGMLVRAATELNLDLARSFMVGDRGSDMEAGRGAGCRTILLTTAPADPSSPDAMAADWPAVVRQILESR